VPFSCDLSLDQDPDMDSLVIATSWKENRKAFYYNQKDGRHARFRKRHARQEKYRVFA
jgi:hypothetical protein